MEARFQRRVQRYGWDKAAPHYEPSWAQPLAEAQQRILELAGARPGEHVLDVACGSGLVTLPLAQAVGPKGSVLGTDLSEAMVEEARRCADLEGLRHVRFEHMGAEKLSVPDGTYDLGMCALGLMYVPDTLAAVREMHRVLRPGGRVALLVWGRRSHCAWAEVFPIVDARVASEVCPLFFRLGGEGVLAGELAEAGFSEIHVERLATTLEFAGDDEVCTAFFAGGPVALAYHRFDAATRDAVHAEYLASIAAYRNGSGYRIPGEFLLATAYKAPGA